MVDIYESEINLHLNKNLSDLKILAGFLAEEDSISKEVFSRITNRFTAENKSLTALSWNKYVNSEDVANYIEQNRTFNQKDYIIWHPENTNCKKSHEDIIAVQFIVPFEKNKETIGLNINCEINRQETIKIASSSDRVILTPPISLVQKNQKDKGVLLLYPVRKNNKLNGFLVGVYELKNLFNLNFYENLTEVTCKDITDDPVLFFSNLSPSKKDFHVVNKTFRAGGRTYEMNFRKEVSITERLIITVAFFILSILFYLFVLMKNQKEKTIKRSMIRLENMTINQEILIKEIHHRVKNNLQIIISLISLEKLKKQKDNKLENVNHLTPIESRIFAMASAHEQLYASENVTEITIKNYMDKLFSQNLNLFETIGKYELDIDDSLEFNFDKSLLLGLIINELITNSIKHALNKEVLKLSLSITKFETKEFLKIIYKDNGKSISKDAKEGLGLKLIQNLTKQLRGNIVKNEITENGYYLKIEIPTKNQTQ